jgi:hypothetical protein
MPEPGSVLANSVSRVRVTLTDNNYPAWHLAAMLAEGE